MKLSVLRAEIAAEIRREGDVVVTDTSGGMIDSAINEAKRKMALRHDFGVMEQVATKVLEADTPSYALGTRFKGLIPDDKEAGGSVILKKVADGTIVTSLESIPTKGQFDRLVITDDPVARNENLFLIDDALTGLPLVYTTYRQELWLFPVVADATLAAAHQVQINYYEMPADYASDNDEDWFLVFAIPALRNGAKAHLMETLRQFDKIEYYSILFESDFKSAMGADLHAKWGHGKLHMGV